MQRADTTTTQTPDAGFRPVQGASASRSGPLLLVEAYAALWVLLLLFVWKTNVRQKRLEERIEAIASQLRAEQRD